jgi:hypothetical protein
VSCETEDSYREALTRHSDWLVEVGLPNVQTEVLARREQLLLDLLMHFLYYRIQAAMEQFCIGLGPLYSLVRQVTIISVLLSTEYSKCCGKAT